MAVASTFKVLHHQSVQLVVILNISDLRLPRTFYGTGKMTSRVPFSSEWTFGSP